MIPKYLYFVISLTSMVTILKSRDLGDTLLKSLNGVSLVFNIYILFPGYTISFDLVVKLRLLFLR